LTLRELLWMYDGKMKSLYGVIAPITHILANVNRAAHSPAVPYSDCNPYAEHDSGGGGDVVVNSAEEAIDVFRSWGVKA
jgi:hypothetical protein